MCIRTVMVHLDIHQHACQNPKYYKSSEPLHLFLDPIFMPVTLYPWGAVHTAIRMLIAIMTTISVTSLMNCICNIVNLLLHFITVGEEKLT